MPFRRANVLAAILPVMVIVGGFPGLAVAFGSGPQPPHPAAPSRNAAGAALLARVVTAYQHVPAGILVDRGSTETVTFTQILKAGKVVSEQAVATANGTTTVLVSRNGPPTFAKEPGTSCWRPLPRSSGQNLTDVGQPFLTHLFLMPDIGIGAPRHTATGWTVTVSQAGTSLTFEVTRSMLLQSMVGTRSGKKAELDINNLTRAPELAAPAPRC